MATVETGLGGESGEGDAVTRTLLSLSVATPTEHVPVDFELYLPKSWTEDPARRKRRASPMTLCSRLSPNWPST
jgi:SRSO17 transposase